MQTGDTNFIYKNEIYKACFRHDMAYGKAKDLAKRTQSDKVLKDKSFTVANYNLQLLFSAKIILKLLGHKK